MNKHKHISSKKITIDFPKAIIRKKAFGRWICSSPTAFGAGDTPNDAYKCWLHDWEKFGKSNYLFAMSMFKS
jgi:hypothetical protein